MTLENWHTIMFLCIRSEVPEIISMVFLVSWIFIGNYILLNLFLAILLDGFAKERIEEEQTGAHEDEEEGEGDYISQDFDLRKNITMNSTKDLSKKCSIGDMMVNTGIAGNSVRSSNAAKSRIIRSMKSFFPKLKVKKMPTQANDIKEEILAGELENEAPDESSPLKEQSKRKKKFVYYQGLFSEKSIYLFSKESIIRRACYRSVKSSQFDNIILLLIILSSFKLVIDTYINDDAFGNSEQVYIISQNVDYFFNTCFIFEALMKTIAYGFVMEPNCYMREAWNVLDFFIVFASLLDMSIDSLNIDFIRILRLLRILRPLRFISHNRNMKVVINALLESIGGIINVVIVMLLIW